MKTLIFDFDGTLVDSVQAHLECYTEICKQRGIEITPESFRRANNGPANKYYDNLGVPQELHKELWHVFKEHFPNYSCPVFSGIPEMLNQLKKRGKLAIATTNRRRNLEAHFKEHLPLFDMVVTGDDVHIRKAEGLKMIVSKLGDSVLIGDMIWDYEASVEAGIPFLGVGYGGWQNHKGETRFQVFPTVSSLREHLLNGHYSK